MYAVVIINKEYGRTRANANKTLRYQNLGPVEQDLVRVRATLAILGIPESNIKVLEDVTFEGADACWDDLKTKYKAAGRKIDP